MVDRMCANHIPHSATFLDDAPRIPDCPPDAGAYLRRRDELIDEAVSTSSPERQFDLLRQALAMDERVAACLTPPPVLIRSKQAQSPFGHGDFLARLVNAFLDRNDLQGAESAVQMLMRGHP
ncbi:hypothetical protein [Dyella sp. C11]|uniref:hypothetical protein n=1 Tax=Dyella sp. C11 TaxID=2126991 RepID=UPI001300552C|nr:hypothetical protein [Dyella sp. C11]